MSHGPDGGPGGGPGLLDALPDGAVVADPGGVVVAANRAARDLLGGPDPVGRPLVQVMTLQDLEGRTWAQCVNPYGGVALRRGIPEQAWRLPDGTELLVTTHLERRVRGGPVVRVGVSLRSARARDRLDRERSDLVATVAHELRSPLTGVKGFTASMLNNWGRFSDEQKRLIMQSVHSDTDRLTRLIAELLDVARIDTNRLSLHARPVDLSTVVAAVTASIHAGGGRPVTVELPDHLPQLHADPDRLAQVVTNLVENAVRHGEGRILVCAVPVDHPGELGGRPAVRLVVEDQGDGISEDIRRRVFTKFWKHGTRGGSGLGMYVVHGLVTAHHGRVSIGDAEGGGARIEVLWPAVVTAETAFLD